MWFKNLALYRFTEPFNKTAEELEQQLMESMFRPCGSHDEFSMGWTSPTGQADGSLVHAANGCFMICLKKQEKVLPTSVVNELLEEAIAVKEDKEARKLSKKERSQVKDELIFELLPKAFSFSKKTFAYIDPVGGWVVVDAATPKKAEDVLSFLRKTIRSLPVVPLNTIQDPVDVMTLWLNDPQQVPKDLTLEDECDLRSSMVEGCVVRCKRHDLTLPEIINHLDNGKQVIKLALNWSDRLAFVVDENLGVKRLKFLDLVQDQVADTEYDDDIGRFDVDFTIMTAELGHFLPRLAEIFGGENKA